MLCTVAHIVHPHVVDVPKKGETTEGGLLGGMWCTGSATMMLVLSRVLLLCVKLQCDPKVHHIRSRRRTDCSVERNRTRTTQQINAIAPNERAVPGASHQPRLASATPSRLPLSATRLISGGRLPALNSVHRTEVGC